MIVLWLKGQALNWATENQPIPIIFYNFTLWDIETYVFKQSRTRTEAKHAVIESLSNSVW